MKEKNKRIIILSVIVIAIIIIGIIVFMNKNNIKESIWKQETAQHSLINMNNTENAEVKEGKKENISTKLAEEKTYKNMKIKDIKLIAEGGITKLSATVENTTEENNEDRNITIVFLDEEGNEISKLNTMLPAINAKESIKIDAQTTSDLANAYDFRIE